MLYTLHCASDKYTAVGNVILVCNLQEGDASCTVEQVISLKPFQLRQLGPAEGKCSCSSMDSSAKE